MREGHRRRGRRAETLVPSLALPPDLPAARHQPRSSANCRFGGQFANRGSGRSDGGPRPLGPSGLGEDPSDLVDESQQLVATAGSIIPSPHPPPGWPARTGRATAGTWPGEVGGLRTVPGGPTVGSEVLRPRAEVDRRTGAGNRPAPVRGASRQGWPGQWPAAPIIFLMTASVRSRAPLRSTSG